MEKMGDRKSILIIAERFYPEEFGINDLALEWKVKGYQVSVLTQTPSYPFDKIFDGYKNKFIQKMDWNGITIYRVIALIGYTKNVLLKILSYFSFAFWASWVAITIGRKFDKIFVYQVGPLTQAIPGLLLKKIFGNQLYIWTLDIWPDSVFAYGFKKNRLLTKFLDYLVKIIYKNCDTIFVSCRGFSEKIRKYVPDAKIIFSPQWVPDDLNFKDVKPHDSLNGAFNFTFAGNIGKVQNLENVIRGFSLVSKIEKKIKLNIVGDGSNLDGLIKLVEQERIQDVVFWGRKPLKEMPQWFEGSDVLIISLVDEPIFTLTVPAKFQAYLAAGKPIFCIMNGEVAALVKDNEIGLISKPDDIEEIKKGFETFLNISIEVIDMFRSNMKTLLEQDYNRDKIIQQKTEEILKR
jgi:glycosyltransferase involved in cell wall biosynthesis